LRDPREFMGFVESRSWNRCMEVMLKIVEIAARNILKAGYQIR